MRKRFPGWVGIVLTALVLSVAVLSSILLVTLRPGNTGHAAPPPHMARSGMVFLGDSLAQGVGATTASATLASRVHRSVAAEEGLWNLSVPGATIKQVQDDQLARLDSIAPSRIYLVVGANDVTGQTDPAAFAASYQAVVRALAAKQVPLILLNIPKLASTPAIPEVQKAAADTLTHTLNAHIAASATVARAKIIDVYTFSSQNLTPNSGLLADDNYHPNDAGYGKLADFVLKQ